MYEKIQVFFYGLPRGIKYTFKSIDLLLGNLHNVHRYSVFINKTTYSNDRSQENNEKIDFSLAKSLLQVKKQHLLSYDKDSIINHYQALKDFGNAFDDNGQSLRNLVEQLSTLKASIENYIEPNCYAYIFARPDTLFNQPLLIDTLEHLDYKSIYVPKWQSFGGCNDRFAITKNFNAAKSYGNRIDDALDFCSLNNKPLHSESLVNFSLRRNEIAIKGIDITFSRVRNNGSVVQEDFTNNLWKSKLVYFYKNIL